MEPARGHRWGKLPWATSPPLGLLGWMGEGLAQWAKALLFEVGGWFGWARRFLGEYLFSITFFNGCKDYRNADGFVALFYV